MLNGISDVGGKSETCRVESAALFSGDGRERSRFAVILNEAKHLASLLVTYVASALYDNLDRA